MNMNNINPQRLSYTSLKREVESMYALMHQEGGNIFHSGDTPPSPKVCGKTVVCHNLREEKIPLRYAKSCSCRLKAVGELAHLARAGRTPVFADMREGVLYLFTQEDDGALFIEGSLPHRAKRLETSPCFLGYADKYIEGAAAVGDFLIFRQTDGKLLYSLFDSAVKQYRWLGELPSLPRFQVSIDSYASRRVQVKGVKFKDTLTSLTGPVPDPVAEAVSQSVAEGWDTAVETLADMGYWIEPVQVRFAMRLWDGSLCNVSDPIRVSPADRQGRTRIQPGLLWDESRKGFIGTDDTGLSVQGYCIAVSTDGEMPQEWAPIVKGLEVWVSREPETIDRTARASMAFMHNNDGNFLTVLPQTRPISNIDSDVAAMPSGLLDFYEMPEIPDLLFKNKWTSYTSAIERFVRTFPGNGNNSTCILGYGGFLHIGSADSVSTSLRGNPFVVQGATTGVGGHIAALSPQIVGGGAYTRQYIYVATDRGIFALTLKPDGTHANCRPATQESLAGRSLWLPTPAGVYALTSGGTLICLKDSNASVTLKGLEGVESLLWSNSYREVWLCGPPGSGSVVMQNGRGMRLYTRSEGYTPIEGVYSPMLACKEEGLGQVDIVTTEREESPELRDVKLTVDLNYEGRIKQPSLELLVADTEVDFKFEAHTLSGVKLINGSAFGPGCNRVRIPLMFPSEWAADHAERNNIRFALSGQVDAVEGVRLCC